MNHIMFDVDGTLVESYDFDEQCYIEAVQEVTGLSMHNNWNTYPHVTDKGILGTFIERQAKHFSLDKLEPAVKTVFIEKIKNHVRSTPAQEVQGAKKFLELMKARDDITISIATGGWGETAVEKLNSAGFDLSGIPMASSNDHYSRIEIMKCAQGRAVGNVPIPLTYFGDGEWDLRACNELNVNLVIVGAKVNHHQSINDFTEVNAVLEYVSEAGL